MHAGIAVAGTWLQACKLRGVAQQRSASLSCLQARLLEIHRQTRQLRQQRQGQQVVLAINRSDYMLDEPSSTLLQVGLLLAPRPVRMLVRRQDPLVLAASCLCPLHDTPCNSPAATQLP